MLREERVGDRLKGMMGRARDLVVAGVGEMKSKEEESV
jgi:hypothetical protein